jgi:hypothetical protein
MCSPYWGFFRVCLHFNLLPFTHNLSLSLLGSLGLRLHLLLYPAEDVRTVEYLSVVGGYVDDSAIVDGHLH